MIRLGAFDLLGEVVKIQASAPLADHLRDALGDLSCRDRRRAPTLTVESFADGSWSVSWPDEQRYEGPEMSVAFYDVFGALNEVAARTVAQAGEVGLHGGAVSVHGAGVAVVGHSGAGKSTLTAALVQAGHGYIADELSVVALGGARGALADDGAAARPMLHPYHRPIGMRADGAEAIGIDIPDGPFEYTFPLRADTIGSLAPATPLGLVVFVERDPLVPPEVAEISPAHALHRLSNHTLGTWGLERETFLRLDRLVRCVPAVSVRYGTVGDGVAMVERAVAANSGP